MRAIRRLTGGTAAEAFDANVNRSRIVSVCAADEAFLLNVTIYQDFRTRFDQSFNPERFAGRMKCLSACFDALSANTVPQGSAARLPH